MKLQLFPLFALLVAPAFAFASDPRYTLTEYTMEHCPACVAALQDVSDLASVGIDVRTVNTTVDKAAAEEARRFNLALRPAWRLATADGKEVGRWYGAHRSAIIAATIRAKFPTPDEELPAPPQPLEETTPEEEEGASTESQALRPALAEPVPTPPSSSSPADESEAEGCDLATCDAELYESNDAKSPIMALAITPDGKIADMRFEPNPARLAEIKAKLETLTPEEKEKTREEIRDAVETAPSDHITLAAIINDAIERRLKERETPVDGEIESEEDFRGRAPVAEVFEDASFLDNSRDEWNDRRADPEEAPRDRFERDDEEDESEGRAYLFRRRAPSDRDEEPSCNAALGDRIADRAAASILKGLNGRVDEIKKEAFVKFDRLGAETQDALVAETSAQFKDARNELNRLIGNELEKIEKAALRKFGLCLIGALCIVFATSVFVCWNSYNAKRA